MGAVLAPDPDEGGPAVTGRGLLGTLALALAGSLAASALAGCTTVAGTGRPEPASGPAASRSSSSDGSADDAHRAGGPGYLGVARPFPPLPPVTPAPVPDSYNPAADAPAAVASALAAAKADGRPVLLDFGSGWCQDCQAMSALLENVGVHQVLSRNFHLVTVDVGHYDRNTDLAGRYLRLDAVGIPALVELGPDGRVLHSGTGGVYADARDLSADALAGTLVNWLYTSGG